MNTQASDLRRAKRLLERAENLLDKVPPERRPEIERVRANAAILVASRANSQTPDPQG